MRTSLPDAGHDDTETAGMAANDADLTQKPDRHANVSARKFLHQTHRAKMT
jgi:hypothetical protein